MIETRAMKRRRIEENNNNNNNNDDVMNIQFLRTLTGGDKYFARFRNEFKFYDDTTSSEEFERIVFVDDDTTRRYISSHPEPSPSQIKRYQKVYDADNTPNKVVYCQFLHSILSPMFSLFYNHDPSGPKFTRLRKGAYINRIFSIIMYFGQNMFSNERFSQVINNKLEEFMIDNTYFDYEFYSHNIRNPEYSRIVIK